MEDHSGCPVHGRYSLSGGVGDYLSLQDQSPWNASENIRFISVLPTYLPSLTLTRTPLQGAISGQIPDISLEATGCALGARISAGAQCQVDRPSPASEATHTGLNNPLVGGLIWHSSTPLAIARQMLLPRHLCRASLPPGGEAIQLQDRALEGVRSALHPIAWVPAGSPMPTAKGSAAMWSHCGALPRALYTLPK